MNTRTMNIRRQALYRVTASLLVMSGPNAIAQTVLDNTKVPIPAEPSHPTVTMPGEPPAPVADTYGFDAQSGTYRHPAETPNSDGPHPFKQSLDYLDQNQYALNTKVEAYYPLVVNAAHSWQTIFDMNGHRYMYHYGYWYRNKINYKVYDITDPKQLKVLEEKTVDWEKGDRNVMGAFAVRYSERLKKTIAVQCYEVPRYGVVNKKWLEPQNVKKLREMPLLRGFKIFEITGPLTKDWKLLSETTLDPYHAANDLGRQEGSGCLDIPYFNDKYLFVAGAPDDSFANQEYASVLHSAAQMAFDISDPTQPKRLSTWWAPGQRLGEESEYRKNPRFGNKTSWMGARMPLFIPKPVEQGGKYGYAAMGGEGFWVIDISDPAKMTAVGHIEMPVGFGGTEGDNIDVSKVEKTGIVYYSGYPMNDDCYEPYKDIYAIDVKDPANPKVVGTLPRPVPPKTAPFTDFCQRRGSFGPKRSGYWTNMGTPNPKYIPYAFYNGGMQIFDVSDPKAPTVAAYFVPKSYDPKLYEAKSGEGNGLSEALVKVTKYGVLHGIFVEWDRNLIWTFTNHGVYAISSDLLGKPVTGMPSAEK